MRGAVDLGAFPRTVMVTAGLTGAGRDISIRLVDVRLAKHPCYIISISNFGFYILRWSVIKTSSIYRICIFRFIEGIIMF